MKERVEINGASRDVLELTRDEVRKNGVSVLTHFAGALADYPSRSGATTASNPQFDYPRCGGNEQHDGGTHARAAHLDDDTDAYQMHDQREFLISSATSDLWVCWAGRAHAVASSD